jgi:hypothetical protein
LLVVPVLDIYLVATGSSVLDDDDDEQYVVVEDR